MAPAAKKVPVPPAAPNYKAAYTAAINTNLGTIDINLLNSKATCTVNSFVHLATAGYFNASQCHRVTTGNGLYVLQCGDPYAKAARSCPARRPRTRLERAALGMNSLARTCLRGHRRPEP